MTAIKSSLDIVLKWASVVLFALLVVIVVWQILSRTLNFPAPWSEEAARYTFVWLGFFASALVFSERGHIAVDFLVRKQGRTGQRTTALLAQAAIIALAVLVLIWGGVQASMGAWNQQLSSLPTTLGVMYLVMPITGVIITVYAVHHLTQVLNDSESPYPEDDEVPQDTATPGGVVVRGEAAL